MTRRRIEAPAPTPLVRDPLLLNLTETVHEQVRLWIFRTLVCAGALARLVSGGVSSSDYELFEFIGIACGEDGKFKPTQVKAEVVRIHAELEAEAPHPHEDCDFEANVDWFATQLGLDQTEAQVLRFCVLALQFPCLERALCALGEISELQIKKVLSLVLSVPLSAIDRALNQAATLRSTGTLILESVGAYRFFPKISLAAGLCDKLVQPQADRYAMLSDLFYLGPAPSLSLDDFPHLLGELKDLRAYLEASCAANRRGVNVLVYGPAGTGKTELCRALAASLDLTLFEIGFGDLVDGDHVGDMRLTSLAMAQRILARRGGALILFDECEGIRSIDWSGTGRFRASGAKAWFNRLLESNAVPTFWVSNREDRFDPAHLRRFDFHLNIDIPPKSVREQILGKLASGLALSKNWCGSVADNESLTPAVFARSVSVATTIATHATIPDPERLLDGLLRNAMKVQGHSYLPGAGVGQRLHYLPNAINIKDDPLKLVDAMLRVERARVCLYGPSGTGKTEFVRFIARELALPVLVRTGSNMLGRYVGETEKNIAAAFAEARAGKSILIIDEIDSFLRSREVAVRSWEVSAVNEMLVQMEAFDGFFFATTNSHHELDAACLRRFDLKICFNYLRREQAQALFVELLSCLGIDSADARHIVLPADLVPGDFANVLRQSSLREVNTLPRVVELLADEAASRPPVQRPVGFLVGA